MTSLPRIETERGRAVVVKTGAGEGAARRRHEAALLRRAQHPGVVQLLGVQEQDGTVELRLDHVAGPSLATHPPLGAPRLARIGAAAAATLADLHQLGVVHGNLGPDHILVTGDGRVVLCGFADAAPVAGAGEDGLPERVDVIQLGRVLRRLLEASIEADATPPRSLPAERLARVADDAVDPDGSLTTASELARRLSEVAGTEEATSSVQQERRPGRPTRRRRVGPVAMGLCAAAGTLTLVAAALVVPRIFGTRGDAGGVQVLGPDTAMTAPASSDTPSGAGTDRATGADARRGDADAYGTDSPGTPSTVPAGAAAVSTSPPVSPASPPEDHPATMPGGELLLDAAPACPPIGDTPLADVDADGCPDPWRAVPGGLEAGGRRYTLGGPDDLVAVGDWDCDGTATPALVETASGSVFLFQSWANEQGDVTASAAGTVPGPTGVEVVGDGCDVLVVRSDGGDRTMFGGPGAAP